MDSDKESVDVPSSTAGPSSSQSHKRLYVSDATAYLETVRSTFKNNPFVFQRFVEIMEGFQTKTMEITDVIESISKLFENYPDLVMGFNLFLPAGRRIDIRTNSIGYNGDATMATPVPMVPHQGGAASYATVLPPADLSEVIVTKERNDRLLPTAVLTPVVSEPVLNIREIPSSEGNRYQLVATVQSLNKKSAPVVISHSPPLHPSSNMFAEYAKSKPLEFKHAINYVNKIKNRFSANPEVYHEFLTILNSYHSNENLRWNEAEVYSRVAKLFRHHDDLLSEFAIFLPEASNFHRSGRIKCIEPVMSSKSKPNAEGIMSTPKAGTPSGTSKRTPVVQVPESNSRASNNHQNQPNIGKSSATKQGPSSTKKSSVSPLVQPMDLTIEKNAPSKKKKKLFPPETEKYEKIQADNNNNNDDDHRHTEWDILIEKVQKLLRKREDYDNFLRCLALFNAEIVTGHELSELVTPFLRRDPGVLVGFKQLLGVTDEESEDGDSEGGGEDAGGNSERRRATKKEDEDFVPIDFSHCDRLGTSYCAMPINHSPPECSGRTALCNEVLNDEYICFPVWPEDAVASPPRRTQTEKHVFSIEDQRFELDMVIETNLTMIKTLDTLWKTIQAMPIEQQDKLKLDDSLGGGSPAHNLTAIKRLYGDKAPAVMEGLRMKPVVCVPLVLSRLKDKDDEWRNEQKDFNKYWRKKDEDFYMDVLGHPPINFDHYLPSLNNNNNNNESLAHKNPDGAIDIEERDENGAELFKAPDPTGHPSTRVRSARKSCE